MPREETDSFKDDSSVHNLSAPAEAHSTFVQELVIKVSFQSEFSQKAGAILNGSFVQTYT